MSAGCHDSDYLSRLLVKFEMFEIKKDEMIRTLEDIANAFDECSCDDGCLDSACIIGQEVERIQELAGDVREHRLRLISTKKIKKNKND